MNLITLPGICAIALLIAPTTVPAPAGPGGVYDAATRLVKAIGAGDADHLERAFVRARTGIQFTIDADGKERHAEPDTPFDVFDVDAAGKTFHVQTTTDLLEAAGRLADPKLGRPKTTITSAYADCPSEGCSYVVIEFDRTWGEGKGSRTVPMRATALVRWVGGEGLPFRVFHWHAAVR